MLHRNKRLTIGQWFVTVTAFVMLVGACLGSVMLIFGGGSYERAANLEASSLADAEVSELVGTTQYAKSNTPSNHSLWAALTKTFHLPFADPLGLLTSELPETFTPLQEASLSQSSLFSSIAAWATSTRKIALGWAPADSVSNMEQMLIDNPGINVLSPTWLQVASDSGNVTSQVKPQVVDFAHQRHVQIWALVDNQFKQKLTHNLLSNQQSTQTLINNLVQIAKANHLDGINVDFENMDSRDRDSFTHFIANLHSALAPLHIDLSVDITPDIVNLQDDEVFFHAGLASYCDHIILMAYDEHWATDPTPGPVADVPWVTNSVDDLLNTGVPTDKMVLGLPFYTRFWHVHNDGHVTSVNVGAGQVESILKEHHATGVWDDSLGVMYAKYPASDGYVEVWYETQKTLARKLSLVNDTGLGGVAVWSLYWSNGNTWSNLVQALRQSLS